MLNDSTIKAVRKLKDSNGQYLWQPSLVAGTPDTILGRPVKTSAYMPAIAAGAKTIAFGDFSYYWIADRQGRSFKRLNELYAANGQVGFLDSPEGGWKDGAAGGGQSPGAESRFCGLMKGAVAHMAVVTREEMKNYLRVDYSDDDALIGGYAFSAERLSMDVLRTDESADLQATDNGKVAVMYATAYLYEHREEADHNALTLTLRALLFGARKEGF